jgi:hypothetical protein
MDYRNTRKNVKTSRAEKREKVEWKGLLKDKYRTRGWNAAYTRGTLKGGISGLFSYTPNGTTFPFSGTFTHQFQDHGREGLIKAHSRMDSAFRDQAQELFNNKDVTIRSLYFHGARTSYWKQKPDHDTWHKTYFTVVIEEWER